MPDHAETTSAHNPGPIAFVIDGASFTASRREMSAADLLKLAGLDPKQYDLLQILGPKVEHTFHDADVVELDKCDRFVSSFTGSTPVA